MGDYNHGLTHLQHFVTSTAPPSMIFALMSFLISPESTSTPFTTHHHTQTPRQPRHLIKDSSRWIAWTCKRHSCFSRKGTCWRVKSKEKARRKPRDEQQKMTPARDTKKRCKQSSYGTVTPRHYRNYRSRTFHIDLHIEKERGRAKISQDLHTITSYEHPRRAFRHQRAASSRS